MSVYRFRLQTVLRLRRTDEERARIVLAETNLTLRAAIEFRDHEIARHRELAVTLGPIDHAELLGERQRSELVVLSVVAARQAVDRALSAAAIAQVSWTKAARAVEALERLDRTRRAEHLAESQRLEAIEVDDIVTSAYGRRAALVGSDER